MSKSDAYKSGHRDGEKTARTGRFDNSGRRPTERNDREARDYVQGHADGQDSGRRR